MCDLYILSKVVWSPPLSLLNMICSSCNVFLHLSFMYLIVVVNHCFTLLFGTNGIFLRSPDKGFWACLGDLPRDMPRLGTWNKIELPVEETTKEFDLLFNRKLLSIQFGTRFRLSAIFVAKMYKQRFCGRKNKSVLILVGHLLTVNLGRSWFCQNGL